MGKLHWGAEEPFVPCPPGAWQAVCVDVEDLGAQNRAAPGQAPALKPTIRLVFQVARRDESGGSSGAKNGHSRHYNSGRRLVVWSGYLTNSLHPQSALRPLLIGWIGNEFEKPDFDTEQLIGRSALLHVHHNQRGRACVTLIERYSGSQALLPQGFTRRHQRAGYLPPVPSAYDEPEVFARLLREQVQQAQYDQAGHPHRLTYGAPDSAPPPPYPCGPMTMAQWLELQHLGTLAFGANAPTEIDNLARHLFRQGALQCDTEQAARLNYELRRLKPLKPALAVSPVCAVSPVVSLPDKPPKPESGRLLEAPLPASQYGIL